MRGLWLVLETVLGVAGWLLAVLAVAGLAILAGWLVSASLGLA